MIKKVLVVGANSFIGCALIEALIHFGHDVTGVYNSNTSSLREDILNVPISNIKQLQKNFDEVYILSSFIHVGQQDHSTRKKMFETNIELVDLICSTFCDSRIIFCSSVMAYKPSHDIITEFSETAGLNEYGISKIWGEKIVASNKNYAIVRLAFVYGKGMKLTPMIPSYIKQALDNKIIKVWGNGERKQDYLYISDAINFLIRAGAHNTNGHFLATSNTSISNLEIAQIVAKVTNSDIKFEGIDETPSFYFNNNYTTDTLLYKATTSIDEGIKETIQWIKKLS